MNIYTHPLKRCGKQRLRGKKQQSHYESDFSKALHKIATIILTAAYESQDSKEIIRAAINDIERLRSEYHA